MEATLAALPALLQARGGTLRYFTLVTDKYGGQCMTERTQGAPARTIRVAHSPDSDDAFMFYALANDKLDTGNLRFEHELSDIESLNRRALAGELEVSAVSIHAYAYLADRYALLASGSSMGDGYGPRLVAREAFAREDLKGKKVAVPGEWTTAFLALKLYEPEVVHVVVPFNEIMEYVGRGGAPHSRGPAHPRGRGIQPDRRPRRVVVLRDGPAATFRWQRRQARPRRGDHTRGGATHQGEHPVRPRPSRGGPGLRS